MKNPLSKLAFFTLLIILFNSCNDQNTILKKTITGRPGELVVVISEEAWLSSPGELVRATLAQPQVSLPQDEPIFTLTDVPPAAFTDIFQTTRNIVHIRISQNVEETGVTFRNDVWASPQATVFITAKNNQEFETIFSENSNKIITYLLNAEKERLKSAYRNIHDKAVLNVLQQKYDMSMYVLPGFQIAKEEEDFIWLNYSGSGDILQGIFLYWIDYTSDSILTTEYLISNRNKILHKYVPGPTEGSYMTTEMLANPVAYVFQYDDKYAMEIRGLWKLGGGDFMGGPYILIAVLDEENQKVIVADGYVYAPGNDKRNLLRQIEAMIYSLDFIEENQLVTDND